MEWLLAATEPNSIVTAGIAFAASVGIMGLLARIQRSLVRGQDTRIKRLGVENKECRLDNELRGWRENKLVNILRASNINIPDDYWNAVPPFILQQMEALRKEKEELGD